jgi:hypothetical protein
VLDKILACRLIRASHLSYAISKDGQQLIDSAAAHKDFQVTGYLKDQLHICQPEDLDRIDAFLLGRTQSDDSILAFRGTLPP